MRSVILVDPDGGVPAIRTVGPHLPSHDARCVREVSRHRCFRAHGMRSRRAPDALTAAILP